MESSYQSIELVSSVHGYRGASPPVPDISKIAISVRKIMEGNGFTLGRGLGRGGWSILEPIQAARNHCTCNLRYCGGNSHANKRRRNGWAGLLLLHIQETFPQLARLLQDKENRINFSRQPGDKFEHLVEHSKCPSSWTLFVNVASDQHRT